jgi:hypothetical protein
MALQLTKEAVNGAFQLLAGRLELAAAEPARLVVCGGSALIAMGLGSRTTNDADVVALLDANGQLVSPDPLPDSLLKAASQVARDLGLAENWLNNGPSQGEGGLFQMGLPADEIHRQPWPEDSLGQALDKPGRRVKLEVDLVQPADQGGDPTHISDLRALKPTDAELEAAARWTMTHDVSEGYRTVLRELLRQMGYESVAQKL